MKIRKKVLILLLVVALLPLLASALLYQFSLYRLGSYFASDTRVFLTANAHEHLQSLVEDYTHLLQRDMQTLTWVVNAQIEEIERRLPLTSEVPAGYFTEIEQAFRKLRAVVSQPVSSQSVIFISGLQLNYPPEKDALLTQPDWYRLTLEKRGLLQSVVSDPERGEIHLVVSAPVQAPDGAIQAVTAIEVPFTDQYLGLQLPQSWRVGGSWLLLRLVETEQEGVEKLKILAVRETGDSAAGWTYPATATFLETDSSVELTPILENIRSDKPGAAMVDYRGRRMHWVYGSLQAGKVAYLIMVRHDQVVAQANGFVERVKKQTLVGLLVISLVLLLVAGGVALIALRFSRILSGPVTALAHAATRLAAGDFSVAVPVRGQDELADLSRVFNDLGPKLQDRERMASSLALARDIQRHLQPRVAPEVQGFDLFAAGTPCDETGGDYFDFLENRDNGALRLGLAIGDVSGHGIPAALLMASARGVLRTHAWCHNGDLGRLFQILNRQLFRDAGDERFMTLFYGVIDVTERSLHWNSAGHGPVLCYQGKTAKILELSTTGPPLGVVEKSSYLPLGPIRLEPGDILLLGTDGLWEARNPAGEIFGIERLQRQLEACAELSAEQIYASLLQEVERFRDGRIQDDDVTLMIIKSRAI